MDQPGAKDQGKKKVYEVTTFPVPYESEEIKENITVNINTPSNPSKKQLNNQAINFHLQGNISEAAKYYQYLIKQGIKDHRIFSNYGVILKNLGKLQEAELSTRKAIEINPDYGAAHSNLGNILIDLGKLEEVILLSKSTLESRSINKGYKLRASLEITIANLLQGDYAENLLYLNKSKELISQGAINIITDETDRKHTSAYFKFITSLYPLLEKENKNPNLEKICHLGESHCLSFAHQTILLPSKLKTIQPVLITGGKAWHFANKNNNQWKTSLTEQLKNQNHTDEILISFGEIDCRKDEGILNYTIKNHKDFSEVCEKTIKGYLDYMEKMLSPYYSKKYYFGVPAPTIVKEFVDDLDIKRIKMIQLYNSILKKEVLSRDSYFLDVYKLTSDKNGVNNNIHMCDEIHLSPKCLSILFKNYLYKS